MVAAAEKALGGILNMRGNDFRDQFEKFMRKSKLEAEKTEEEVSLLKAKLVEIKRQIQIDSSLNNEIKDALK